MVAGLDALKARGEANGAEGLEIIDAGGIRRREPHAAGVAALVSPATGVVEPEALVHTLARVVEDAGGSIEALDREPGGTELRVGLPPAP